MSKRKWHHPDVPAEEQSQKAWQTLGEKNGSDYSQKMMEREFPSTAAAMQSEEDQKLSRRSFNKLMGASTALAGIGLASCRRPETLIIPFVNAPEWIIPGKPLTYATSMPFATGAVPLVVTTYEGRPTKLEPNTLHPDSSGTDAIVQASILDLYSPSRSKKPLAGGKTTSMTDLQKAFASATNDLSKVAVVTGEAECPTRNRLLTEAGVKVFSYEPLSPNLPQARTRVAAKFDKADRILSLDCDFTGLDHFGPIKPFFDRRNPEGGDYTEHRKPEELNRLYVAESAYSLTGGVADHRLQLKPSEIGGALAVIARKLGVGSGNIQPLADEKKVKWLEICADDLKSKQGRSLVCVGSRHSAALHNLCFAVNEALQSVGPEKPLLLVSRETVSNGSLQELISAIESGSVSTVIFTTPADPYYDAPADLDLASKLSEPTTFHLGDRVNLTAHSVDWHIPSAHYLESWSDGRSVSGVYSIVQPMILPLYGGLSELELCCALLDGEKRLIGSGEGDSDYSPSHDAVKKTFNDLGAEGAPKWTSALRQGFVENSQQPVSGYAALPTAEGDDVVSGEGLEVIFATDYSMYDGRFAENAWMQEAPDPITKVTWDNAALISPKTAMDLGVYDRIMSLQPKTKLLKVEVENAPSSVDGESETFAAPVIALQVDGKTLELPVLIGFGQADGVVVIPVGYGQGFDVNMREADLKGFDAKKHAPQSSYKVGLVARNSGFNVYPLRKSSGHYFATGAKVTTTESRYKMALTQEHHAMYGRALAREVSTMTTKKGKDFAYQVDHVKKQGMDSHAPENISLYKPLGSSEWWSGDKKRPEPLLNDQVFQWAMAIDLNACTGCSACLVACQAENNIPVVGKQQVAMGRDMHWIRMDRYFAATPKLDEKGKEIMDDHGHAVMDDSNPEMIPQPVACVQCESAPCETVCPVNATVHTEDGLNAMAYNRCIGTRYCANNCPYKARRFNFFDYNKRNPLLEKNLYKGPLGKKDVGDSKHLQRNPNVTVRMRGVMEKCTYCVQRLKAARIKAKDVRKEKSMSPAMNSTEVEVSNAELRAPANSVKVACQEACPTGAITFGNTLVGKKETVVRAKESQRNYDLLNYIGTRPRTSYLARVKNPNPLMPGASAIGVVTVNMH